MNAGSRTPPRFVPTLTAVVDLSASRVETESDAPLSVEPMPPAEVALPHVASHEETPLGEPTPLAAELSSRPAYAALTEADAFRIEEELLHRVLQRVDLSLEERLTEAVSAAVQQQLDAMVPRLRTEIEAVLRSLVVEALARELSENPGSAPGSDAPALG